MKNLHRLLLAFLVLTGISQLRCSDDSSRPTVYEFKVTKIECATEVYLGHPLSVDVTITSNDEAENVPIDMYIAKDSVGDDEEVPFHTAGSYIIPTVKSGENTYTIKVTVPRDEIIVGTDTFRIAATVDPALSISKERPECVPTGDTATDSTKECFSKDTTKEITINSSYNSKQDLLIDNIALTTDVVTIDTGDTIPDFITGTMTIKSVAVETLNVPVRFALDIGGTEHPLMIWDSEIEGYSKDYWIGQLRANDPKSIPFFLEIDATIAGLLASGPNSVTLKATIDPDNKVPEAVIAGYIDGEANNTLTRSLTIVKETTSGGSGSMMSFAQESSSGGIAPGDPQFDITGTGLGFSKNYSQTLGNSRFGARPFFSTWASLNEDGAEGYAGGGVEVSILNASFNFVYMEASAAAVPHMLSSSYVDIYLRFAWWVLYSFHIDGEYSWDKDWTVYKSKGYTATFWAGPIPLNVSAGAQGTMGFAVSFGVGDNLEATASEFASAGAYASASIGIPGFLEGGVKGNLNIVSYETKAVITAGLQLSEGAKQIQGWLQEQVITTLAGPNGTLYLFARYPYQRWCKKWWIYYPCGWPTIREAQTPLVSFTSWSKEMELMNLKQNSPWMSTGL